MEKIKTKILKWLESYGVFLVISVFGLVVLNWFRGDYVIDTLDLAFPYDVLISVKKMFFVWNDFNSLGFLDTRILPQIMPYGLYNLAMFAIGASLSWMQKIFVYLLFVFSGWSVYYFCGKLKFGKVSSFAAAIFYMINPFAMTFIWPMRDLFAIPYALMPLALGSFMNICESRQKPAVEGIKHALFVFIMLTSSFANTVVLLSYIGLIFLYAFITFVLTKNTRGLRLFVIICLALTALSSFWLFPFAGSVKTEFANSENRLQANTDFSALFDSSKSVLSGFSLTGFWALDSGYKGDAYFPWHQKFKTIAGTILKFSPFFFCLLYFLYGEKNKSKIFLSFLFFFGLFALAGTKDLIPDLKMIFFKNSPLFLRMFRNLETKFGPILLIGMAPIVGEGIVIAWKKISEKKLFWTKFFLIAVVFLYAAYLANPIFTGEVIYSGGQIYPSSRVEVPEYYQEAKNWLKNQKGNYHILSLPLSTIYESAYKWPSGFVGTNPDPYLFGRSTLTNNTGQNYIIPSVIAGFQNKDYENFLKVTRLSGMASIKYLALHHDANWEFMQDNDFWIETSPEFFSAMEKYGKVFKFDQVSFLQIPNNYLNSFIYIPEHIYSYEGDTMSILKAYASGNFYEPLSLLIENEALDSVTDIKPDREMKIVWSGNVKKDVYENTPYFSVFAQDIRAGNLFFYDGNWGRLSEGDDRTESILGTFDLWGNLNLIGNGSFEEGLWSEEAEDCSSGWPGNAQINMSLSDESFDGKKSMKLDSENHYACVNREIFPYIPESGFIASLKFKNLSGNYPEVCVFEDVSNKCVFNEKLSLENSQPVENGWREWNKIFESRTSTARGFLYLYTPSKNMPSSNLFDDVVIKKLPLKIEDIILSYREESGENNFSGTKISFERVNQTLYHLRVAGAKKGTPVVFTESFDKGWKLSVINKGDLTFARKSALFFGLLPTQMIEEKNHIVGNGYANVWHIDVDKICNTKICRKNKNGGYDFDMVLEFYPQRLFYFGAFITVISLLVSIRYLWHEYNIKSK